MIMPCLSGDGMHVGYLSEEEGSDSIGGITLVCILLDHKTLVQLGLMALFMLVLIVGVQAMGHVCRHQKTSLNCSLKKPLNINNIQDTMHLSSTKSVSAIGRYCNYKSVWCVLNPFGTSSQYDR
jgi:hypothetical protein